VNRGVIHRFRAGHRAQHRMVLPKGQSGSDPLQIKTGQEVQLPGAVGCVAVPMHLAPGDVPFTVSLTATHIAISWDEKVEPLKRKTHPGRVLALDFEPQPDWRCGTSSGRVKPTSPSAGRIYDYPELNRKVKRASDHPDSIHQRDKRVYELSCIAREVTNLAVHFRCSAVITEHLNIPEPRPRQGALL